MDTLFQDLRFGFRQLRRTPAFAIIAVLTLALGIGANTAIFSAMNAVVLRSLPVADADRLVFLHYNDQPKRSSQTGYDDTSMSEPAFEALRQQRSVFSDLMAFVPLGSKVGLRYGDDLQTGHADMVSGNFFSGLGIRPAIGRTFTADDEKQHTPTAVLSYSYWNSRFSRDPGVIGQTLYVKGVPVTIVGVASPGFIGLERRVATDVWVPFQTRSDLKPWGSPPQDPQSLYGSPSWFFLMTIGRLQPGLTESKALAQINPVYRAAVYSSMGAPDPKEPKIELSLTPARGVEGLNSDYKQPLRVLMVMVGVVLLIACANVAMLLIARNTARDREFSVRVALGGSRARIFRQLLTESLLLVAAGAALGWMFASWATRSLAAWSQMEVNLAPDRSVLWFTIGVSALAALVFGLAPLRSATRAAAGVALKTSAASARQDKARSRTGKLVISLQMSLCLALLVTAGLLLRTLNNLHQANLGFKASGLLVFGVNPPAGAHSNQQVDHFYETLLQRVRALPEVESATVMENRIGSGWSDNTAVRVDGANPLGGDKFAAIRWNPVGPDFLHVLGVTPKVGRDFTEADSGTAAKVIVVNQTFADRYLANRNPLGHQVALELLEAKFSEPYTIVGVVSADMRYTAVRQKPAPMGYIPYKQLPIMGAMQVELRTRGNPAGVLNDVRGIVREFGPDLPLLDPKTQTEQLEESYSDERLFSRLATFFGVLAALLVATGLYGALAYRVSRRTAEIGVRMALGAQRKQVLWMVLRESLIMAVIGIGVGLPLAFAGARLLRSMLFGLSPADPLTFLFALLGIALVATFSALLPARRASSVDPMVALRYE